MSCVSGTNVVNDGLVFAFDMSNTQKSWKGRPTTNFTRASNNNIYQPNNRPYSGLPHAGGGGQVTTEVNPPHEGLTVYKVIDDGVDSQNARYSFRFNMDDSWMDYDDDYVWSIYIYLPEQFKSRWLSFTRSVIQNSTGADWHGSRGYNSTYNFYGAGSIDTGGGYPNASITGTWQRMYVSFKALTANIQLPQNNGLDNNKWVAGYLRANINNAVNNTGFPYHLYLAGGQLEKGVVPSPFASDSRSNTEAIIDISGQGNTITANNPSYNSDGSFEFDSVNSKITSPVSSSDFVDTNFTFLAWVKGDAIFIEGGLQNMPHIGWGSASWPRLGLQAKSGYWEFRQFPNSSDGSITKCGKISTTEWKQIVAVGDYTNGEVRGYENGELYATGIFKNSSGNGNTLAVGTSAIATSWNEGFVGKIDKVKLYNRALSATEIKQNFEATRSIYGI
jgi:hypothetical protein